MVVDLDEVEGNGGAGSQSNGGKKKKKKKKKNESEEGRSTATSPATSPSKRMDVGKASEVARDSSPSSEGREGGAGEAAYYSYESDSFDPALVDEEEVPTEELPDDGATTDTSKGKARASQFFDGGGSGYNSLKSFEGQLYSGMAIGASNTWWVGYKRITGCETRRVLTSVYLIFPGNISLEFGRRPRRNRISGRSTTRPTRSETTRLPRAAEHRWAQSTTGTSSRTST